MMRLCVKWIHLQRTAKRRFKSQRIAFFRQHIDCFALTTTARRR
ncbi:hypothetical protein PUN4_310053 [Paraburkholderia unamae]|nr:hypothetical protein PUN4_310053 [Paraburkholderia unamae]